MTIRQVRKHGHIRWRVAWVDGSGRERRRFFRTRDEARLYASTVTAPLSPVAAFSALTHAQQVDALRAAELAAAGGYSLTDAARHYSSSHPERVSTSVALSEFLAVKEAQQGVRPATLKALRLQVGRYLDHARPDTPTAITAGSISEWIASHDWSPRSRNACLEALNTFLRWCRARGYISVVVTDAIPRAIAQDREVAILSVDQARSLMRAAMGCDRGMVGYLSIAMFAGVRPGELARISARDIDLDAGIVDLTGAATKTRRSRLVHLTPNAIEWLRVGGDVARTNIRRRMEAIRRAAGIDAWPHDVMRHSFATYYLALHGLAETAMESGNSEQVLLKHYRRPVPRAEAERYFSIVPTPE